MQKSETINELATALAKAQGEFISAKMDKVNPFLKNKYADLGSVISAAKVACAKYGLAVSQPASTDGAGVTVETILMHQTGQWISSSMTLPLGDEKGRSIAQAAGSIITYLRRYSLSAMLGIYADEDTDSNEKTGSNGHKQAIQEETIPEPEPMPTGPAAVANAGPMTIDEAKAVINRDGVPYGEIETKNLLNMANSLAKLAKRTPEQETKLLAIQIIMEARNADK